MPNDRSLKKPRYTKTTLIEIIIWLHTLYTSNASINYNVKFYTLIPTYLQPRH